MATFKDLARRDEFWQRLEALLDEYPEIMAGFDDVLDGEMDERGLLFNPDTPKYWQGFVLIVSVRNMDDWESMVVLDPAKQSGYMTDGLLTAAIENNI